MALTGFVVPVAEELEETRWEQALDRVVVDGDLAQPQLGLGDEAFAVGATYTRVVVRDHQEPDAGRGDSDKILREKALLGLLARDLREEYLSRLLLDTAIREALHVEFDVTFRGSLALANQLCCKRLLVKVLHPGVVSISLGLVR